MVTTLLLSTLVLTSLASAQDCTLLTRTYGVTPQTVCNEAGTVTVPKGAKAREFYADSYSDCLIRSQFDYTAATIEWNTDTNACTFYYAYTNQLKFQPDSSSASLFTSYKCYNLDYGCPIPNPDFENPPKNANGVKAFPTQYDNGYDQISLSPWNGNSRKTVTYWRLANNKKLPQGAKKTPNGRNFVIARMNYTDGGTFVVNTRLKPATTYNFSMLWSYIQFAGNRSNQFSDYRIAAYWGKGQFYTEIATVQPDQKNGDDDGVWRLLTGSFTTPNKIPPKPSDDGNLPFGISIASPGKATPSDYSVFGFDLILLSEATS